MIRLGHAAALIAVTGLLAGCAAGPAAATDAATRTRLRHDVATLTAAAASRNYPAARDALSVLTTDLATAQAAGQLSPAKLAQLRGAIAAIHADLATAASSKSPSTAPAARTTAATGPPATPSSAAPTRAAGGGTVAPPSAPNPKHSKGKKGGKGH